VTKADSWQIRLARPADAEALAELEVAVWRAAYSGLLPSDLLEGLSAAQKAKLWLGYLEEGVTTFVLESQGRTLGFAGCGPVREDPGELPVGEIYAIYVSEGEWGRGYGRALFERCKGHLAQHGLSVLVLWVLRENRRAREFYERQGMILDGAEKRELLEDVLLEQVLYCLPSGL
jgi:GNAT superfamily N-acetyltransferase